MIHDISRHQGEGFVQRTPFPANGTRSLKVELVATSLVIRPGTTGRHDGARNFPAAMPVYRPFPRSRHGSGDQRRPENNNLEQSHRKVGMYMTGRR